MSKENKHIVSYGAKGYGARFTCPISKASGEQRSYDFPTYSALRSLSGAIFGKPQFYFNPLEIRVMKEIKRTTVGTLSRNFIEPGGDRYYHSDLLDVEYQIKGEIRLNREQIDRDSLKGLDDHCLKQRYFEMFKRYIGKPRMSPFMGVSDYPAEIFECEFGEGESFYDENPIPSQSIMFHRRLEESGEKLFFLPKIEGSLVKLPDNDAETLKQHIAKQ